MVERDLDVFNQNFQAARKGDLDAAKRAVVYLVRVGADAWTPRHRPEHGPMCLEMFYARMPGRIGQTLFNYEMAYRRGEA